MNREAFLAALRAELIKRYGTDSESPLDRWAADPAKLDRFLTSVTETITTTRSTVNINSPSFVAAWRAIGGKGKPTYKGLRALPIRGGVL